MPPQARRKAQAGRAKLKFCAWAERASIPEPSSKTPVKTALARTGSSPIRDAKAHKVPVTPQKSKSPESREKSVTKPVMLKQAFVLSETE